MRIMVTLRVILALSCASNSARVVWDIVFIFAFSVNAAPRWNFTGFVSQRRSSTLVLIAIRERLHPQYQLSSNYLLRIIVTHVNFSELYNLHNAAVSLSLSLSNSSLPSLSLSLCIFQLVHNWKMPIISSQKLLTRLPEGEVPPNYLVSSILRTTL